MQFNLFEKKSVPSNHLNKLTKKKTCSKCKQNLCDLACIAVSIKLNVTHCNANKPHIYVTNEWRIDPLHF